MDIEKLKALIEQREDVDAQIIALVTGGGASPKKERAPQKCSKCGMEGHSARTCTQAELKLNGS